MEWTRPQLAEIKMDAEIGSYQLDDERDESPFARDADAGDPDH